MRIDTGSYEWALFLARLPVQPYREGLTEGEVQEFLEGWEADGGSADSFIPARRVVGPWEFSLDTERVPRHSSVATRGA